MDQAEVFRRIASIISEVCDVPREDITKDVHIIDGLGVDSLDHLDVVFAIDKEFGIHIPNETWNRDITDGKIPSGDIYRMDNYVQRVFELVETKHEQD